MSNEETLSIRIEDYLKSERNEPILLNENELILCMLALKLQVIDKESGSGNDDVCEWKLEDEEANLYLTGCQQRQLILEGTPKENGYRYCPYCGKKIKIVGD